MLRSKNLKAGKFCSATRHYVLQNMTFQLALLEGLYGLTVVRTVSLQTEIWLCGLPSFLSYGTVLGRHRRAGASLKSGDEAVYIFLAVIPLALRVVY